MMISTMHPILRKILKICVPIAVYIVIWQLLSMLVGSRLLLLPSPLDTLRSMYEIVASATGWQSIGMTFIRIIFGYVFGCVLGIGLAVLTSHFHIFEWLFNPLRSLIKTTPITSFALILLVSVVSGVVPVIVAMIVVVPMIWQTMEEAIRNRDVKLSEMAQIYLSPWKKFCFVTLPQVMPRFYASASTALGFAWKAVITAEILALPKFGIGRQMQFHKIHIEIPELFAWTLLVIILSVILESFLKFILRKARQKYD